MSFKLCRFVGRVIYLLSVSIIHEVGDVGEVSFIVRVNHLSFESALFENKRSMESCSLGEIKLVGQDKNSLIEIKLVGQICENCSQWFYLLSKQNTHLANL